MDNQSYITIFENVSSSNPENLHLLLRKGAKVNGEVFFKKHEYELQFWNGLINSFRHQTIGYFCISTGYTVGGPVGGILGASLSGVANSGLDELSRHMQNH
ncbi:MAG: hypothetical protein WCT20_03115 [Candidatus Babeliales bacterium]